MDKGRIKMYHHCQWCTTSSRVNSVVGSATCAAAGAATTNTFEKFIKNVAKHFKGSNDPMEAENWIKIMLMTFKATEAPDQHWVLLATCMLEGEAQFLWESAMINNFAGHEVKNLASQEFLSIFVNRRQGSFQLVTGGHDCLVVR